MSGAIPTSPQTPVTLASLERLQAAARSAVDALRVLVDPARTGERQGFFQSLRAGGADYARVFASAAVPVARGFYKAMWAQPMAMPWNLRQTGLRVAAALAEDFIKWNARAEPFPARYRSVARYLQPGVIWGRWERKEPGVLYGPLHRRTGPAGGAVVLVSKSIYCADRTAAGKGLGR